MTKVDFNMSEFEDFIKNVRANKIDSQFKTMTNEIAQRWKDRASDLSPWDTHLMQNSFYYEGATPDGNTYKAIVANMAIADDGSPYPIYVEYGHRVVRGGETADWRPGAFMMTRARKDIEDILPQIVDKHIKKAWEEL